MSGQDEAGEQRGDRDRDTGGRPRNARPRDGLGRPLPYGAAGVEREPPGIGRTPIEALGEAQRLLDAGMPFHAHEVLEDAWKAAPGAERQLWRGLAQLAVGAAHAARGNRVGAVSLVDRGASAISPYAASAPYGLDVDVLLRWAADAAQRVEVDAPVVLPPPRLVPAGHEHRSGPGWPEGRSRPAL